MFHYCKRGLCKNGMITLKYYRTNLRCIIKPLFFLGITTAAYFRALRPRQCPRAEPDCGRQALAVVFLSQGY